MTFNPFIFTRPDTAWPDHLKPGQRIVYDYTVWTVYRESERIDDTGRQIPGNLVDTRDVRVYLIRNGKEYVLDLPHYTNLVIADGHHAVCVKCGDPWPCRHIVAEKEAKRQAPHIARIMALLPGCCPACGEPITRRQKTVTFEGPNLLRPDFPDGAVFHTRRRCFDAAELYDRRWAVADPRRVRKLHCDGLLVRHATGEDECSYQITCPGPNVWHGSYDRHDVKAPGYARGCWCIAVARGQAGECGETKREGRP